MKRGTSINAYNEIKTNGLLSARRLQVYQILFKYGPMSAAEVVNRAAKTLKVSNSGNFATRLSELRRMGRIQEVKTAPCPLTGYKVIFWDINGELPQKLNKKESKDAQIKRLENKVSELEKKLKARWL